MEQSESIKTLTVALIKARQLFRPLVPDKVNPHFHSKYASLNQCIEVTESALSGAGLTVTQWLEPGPDEMLACTTQLQHESGEWQRSTAYLPIVKMDPQAAGSAVTYARRYGYCAALGLSPDEDDDANGATGGSTVRHQNGEARSDAGNDMVVTWGKSDPANGKAPSRWHGKKFSEVWAAGKEGHSYLHWVAEKSTLNAATKAAARAFLDAVQNKAPAEQSNEPMVFATEDEIQAFREFYEKAGLDLEVLDTILREVGDKYSGVPAKWLEHQNERVLATLTPAKGPHVMTPEDDIPFG